MAIKSYDDVYLEDVSTNIGTMFQYAIDLGYDYNVFWDMFVSSFVAKEIEKGNPKYLVGHSAIDLLDFVINENKTNKIIVDPKPFFDLSAYYWGGWAIAQYQNYKNVSFFNLNKLISIEKVLSFYDNLHEADITKFYEVVDEYLNNNKQDTNLKQIRNASGLSQSQLAKKAEVSIRNIQMYEQRQNDINKAQADILFRLSKVLGCKIEDLFEM